MPPQYSQNNNLSASKSISTQPLKNQSWIPYVAIGVILSLGAAIALNITTTLPQFIILGVVFGLLIAFIIFQSPEAGAYILIIAVFTNLSDLFTEKGLPSITKPLIAIVGLSIFAHYIFKTEKRLELPRLTRIEVALLTYFAVIFASSLIASDRSVAFNSFFDVLKDAAVGLCILITLNTKAKLKTGVAALILSVAIISVLGVYKTFTGTEQTFFGFAQNSAFGQVNESGVLRYGGPIAEANVWAQVLAAVLPFSIYQFIKRPEASTKIIMILSTAFIFLALLLTQSRGAILALFFVLPIMALEMRINAPTLLFAAAIGLIALLLVPSQYTERIKSLQIFFQADPEYGLTQDESVAGRREKMLTGLAMFTDRPILGVGFGNYNTNYWDYAGRLGFESGATDIQGEKGAREPHSLYIEIMSETGLLGILSFLTFFVLLFSGLYKTRKLILEGSDKSWSTWITSTAIAILSFLISGFFLHGIRFRYIWVLIGLALATIYISKPTSSNTLEETLQ